MLLYYLVKVKKIENVILQREITKEKLHQMYRSFIYIKASSKWIRVIMCLKFTYLGVIQQCVYKTIQDVDNP